MRTEIKTEKNILKNELWQHPLRAILIYGASFLPTWHLQAALLELHDIERRHAEITEAEIAAQLWLKVIKQLDKLSKVRSFLTVYSPEAQQEFILLVHNMRSKVSEQVTAFAWVLTELESAGVKLSPTLVEFIVAAKTLAITNKTANDSSAESTQTHT